MDTDFSKGWIGVDLDGTLAEQRPGQTGIGKPVPAMLKRVRAWLNKGYDVRVFTTRADQPGQVKAVKAWLKANELPALEVTNIKAPGLLALWDNRAVRVQTNTGRPCSGCANSVSLRAIGEHEDLTTDC